jgi:hypothetical protein
LTNELIIGVVRMGDNRVAETVLTTSPVPEEFSADATPEFTISTPERLFERPMEFPLAES